LRGTPQDGDQDRALRPQLLAVVVPGSLAPAKPFLEDAKKKDLQAIAALGYADGPEGVEMSTADSLGSVPLSVVTRASHAAAAPVA